MCYDQMEKQSEEWKHQNKKGCKSSV